MNEHHMRFLVEDRQRDLRAEADRARLARQARIGQQQRRAVGVPSAPRLRRPRLVDLLARLTAPRGRTT